MLLYCLAASFHYVEKKLLFGKHGLHLSTIFWKFGEHLHEREFYLAYDLIDKDFMKRRTKVYESMIYGKGGASKDCVESIDGMVYVIVIPKRSMEQRVVHNGQKCKTAWKFQAVSSFEELILNFAGSIEERRHDSTLYIRSFFPEDLPFLLEIDSMLYCLYDDSGYDKT